MSFGNYPSLRVAYIDEVEETSKDKSNKMVEKVYYSALVKAVPKSLDISDPSQNLYQVIYRIKLPGPALLGGGKPENQNHAIIFTRGEGLQTIDLNQDNYMEEAFKMRNLLQEFLKTHMKFCYELLKRESSRSRGGISLMSLSKIDLENMVRSGNVALDVARLLLRPTMELATTDIASSVLAALNESSIRRGPVQAACTTKEFPEILGIKDLYIHIRNVDLLTTSSHEGQSICSHFSRFGICKFGPSCKYDHSATNDILASSNGSDQGRHFQFNCFGDEYGEWEVEQMLSVW
ncbi:hypothetical protein POM88_013010 [Heracleum sosnowskyi]|uniref:C3H1-type domain-containing protein n=1 Tax=Heracleum sosnowskyi TaxID=360622 RepID=A0AAD8IXJ4_9APIA|nr:hypothetical protein POM88_013010 [Heracleum sosnowskyi]